MIKALMVDVDGVLVRGRPHDGRHWSTSLEADLGLRVDDLQRHFFDLCWDDVIVGRVPLTDALHPVLKKIAPHLTPHQLITYWFDQDSGIDRQLLNELAVIRDADIPVYLATNQEHDRAQYLMENLGLANHVDGIHYSAQLGAKKPSREFFDKVAATMGIDPGELLLVDDTLANIEASKAAGWEAFHWTGEGLLMKTLGTF